METSQNQLISSLKPDEKMWMRRVLLLLKFGIEAYIGKQKSGNLQKLIFLDRQVKNHKLSHLLLNLYFAHYFQEKFKRHIKIQAIMFDDIKENCSYSL